MSLSPEAWDRVKELFHAALLHPPQERHAFLAAQGDGTEVVAEARALLHAFDEAADGEGPRAGAHADASPVDLGEGCGTIIGRYKVLQKIGEGGFGTVFMAEQLEPVRRQVAFKILKAGMDTKRVIARFEAERQALAMMDHQNIARVFDAGSTVTGRPYFVMELVRGVPITSFCDGSSLDTDQRLDLFLQVCSAVQHAHTKGVIHRDLKPSNVLVTLHDGEPVVKVIDFGIAKATAHRLTEHTLFTEFQQVVGTPDYMAPEQAEMSGLDVDTRADIYSLGVLLYEILTGSKPFDIKSLMRDGYEAVLRQIREVDPPRPSTRISTLGAEATTIAKRRGTDARRLQSTLRGDLDWVVMKALAKDRTRRYETAAALALDIRRFRAHEAVAAGPPSTLYRVRKTLRRHRAAAVTAAAVSLSLIVGLALALWQARIASARAADATRSAELSAQSQAVAERREHEAAANLERAVRAETEAQTALAAERAARQAADGHRLAAQAIALAREDPPTSLLLALEGHRLAAGEDARAALYTVLDRHRLLGELDGHDGACDQLATSLDGHCAVSADATRLVLLWDLEQRRIRHRIDVHDDAVVAVGMAPDGSVAFTASRDATVRLWEVASGEEVTLLRHPAALRDARMSPSGRQLFTACDDLAVRRFDLDSGAREQEILRCASTPLACTVSGDGQRVAVLEDDMVVHVLDAGEPARRAPRRLVLSRDRPPPYYNVELWYRPTVELSADGSRVLTRSRAGHVGLWDAGTGALVHEHAGSGRFCGSAKLSPDGRLLFLLRRDLERRPEAQIVVAETGAVVANLEGPVGLRVVATFSPDGRTVAGVEGATATVWRTGSGEAIGHLQRDPHGITSIAFAPDGEYIVTGSHNGALHLWAVSAFPERRGLTLAPPGARRYAVSAVSPDGSHAVCRLEYDDRRPTPIALFETGSGRAVLELAPPGAQLVDARFSDDGQLLAVCLNEPFGLTVWEVAARRPVLTRPDLIAQHARFARGGKSMALRHREELVLFDLQRGLESGRLPVSWTLPANLSPDGSRLVRIDGPAQTVSVWDTATRRRVGLLEHRAFAFDGAFSPDGRHLVTLANDGGARVLDAATLEILHTCRVPTADYAALAFSPDGSRFAVTADREVLVFVTRTGERVARWADPLRLGDVRFTPDGAHVMVPRRAGDVRLLPLDAVAWARARVPFELPALLMHRYGIGTEGERTARARDQAESLVPARKLVAEAEAVLDAGRPDEALLWLQRAHATRPRMPARYHYVEACARAVASARPGSAPADERADRDAALVALRRLVETGYGNADVLETAPHLATLRDDPAFRELLASLR